MPTKTVLIAILAGLAVVLAGVLGWQKLTQPATSPALPAENQPQIKDMSPSVRVKIISNEERIAINQELKFTVSVDSLRGDEEIRSATIEIQVSDNLTLLTDTPIWKGSLGPKEQLEKIILIKGLRDGVGKISVRFVAPNVGNYWDDFEINVGDVDTQKK